MADALRVERRDDKAPPRSIENDAVVPQQQQSLLDRLSRHAVSASKLVLNQTGVRGQTSVRNLSEDGVVNKPDELVAVRRLGLSFAGAHFTDDPSIPGGDPTPKSIAVSYRDWLAGIVQLSVELID